MKGNRALLWTGILTVLVAHNARCAVLGVQKFDRRSISEPKINDCPNYDKTICAKVNDGDVVQLPNQRDCASFYYCDHGELVLRYCPEGLHYNTKLRTCDYPETAHCVPCGGGNNDGSNEDGNGGEGDCPEVDRSQCPTANEGNVVQLANPRDCSTFYKCDHGVPVLQRCPAGLLYNAKLQVCDYPNQVHCVPCGGGNNDGSNEDGNSGEGDCPEVDRSQCPATNEGNVVQLANPRDCSTFYKCDHGVPVLQRCPAGLLYNAKLQVCDYPNQVHCVPCGGGNNDGSNEDGNSGEGDCPEVDRSQCPATNEGNVVQLANPRDCSTFYKCDHGVPVLQRCPAGLLYNAKLQVCDYPNQVHCVPCGGGNNDGSNEDGNSGEGDCPEVDRSQCPATNEGNVVQLANPRDCSTFYKCDHGVPVLQRCPAGLLYNAKLQVCDYPNQVHCVPCGGGNNDGSNEDGNSGEGDCPEVDRSQCPATNEGNVVQLANPRDCSTFYKCDHGVPVLQRCPAGLLYNAKLQVCDYPNQVHCVPCGGGNNDGSNEDGNSGEGDCPEVDRSQCPATNEGNVVQLANPRDCSTFYKCDHGVPVLQRCPAGLLYNAKLQVCDYPNQVHCVPCGGGNNDGSNEDGNSGEGDCPEVDRSQCPATNEGNVVQLANPRDCSTFYKCDHGVPVLQRCPSGLLYNTKLQVCDYPNQVHCVPCGGGNNDGSNEDGNSGEGDCPEVDRSQCPATNEGNVVQLANPRDCSTFYKCDHGVPVLQRCPSGLLYNTKLQVCDYPNQVHCAPCGGGNNDGSNEDGNSGEGDCPEVDRSQCPATNEGNVVQLANPRDCSTFYKCDHGVPVLQRCPAGLLYNAKLQVCDYPNQVHCVPCGGGNNDGSNEDGNSGEGDCPEVDRSQCPATNEGNVVQLANPRDCSTFYKCDHGVPALQRCPTGLLYNAKLQVCDYPNQVHCVPCGGGNNDGSNEDGNSGEGDCPEVDRSQCPATNEGNVVQLPNPRDCSTFYKCDHGVPVLQRCPAGLLYNAKLQVCDYPNQVHCVPCGGGNNDGSNEDGNSGEGDCPEVDRSQCPATNEGNVVQLANPRDCSTFYKCDHGIPVLQRCPAGLLYNAKLQVCDYPNHVHCVPCGGGNNDGSNEDGNSGGDCPEVDRSQCLATNEGNVVQLANPRDCSTFYKCDYGVPVLQRCPAGLLYNAKLQVCDYPNQVHCVPCGGGRRSPQGV